MFSKLLSTMAVMLTAFCIGTGAQEIKISESNSGMFMPNYAQTITKSTIQPGEDEIWWSYFDGVFGDKMRLLGLGENTEVPMPYSTCLCIPAGLPAAEGKSISGVAFSFPDSKNISDVKIWISNSLPDTPEAATICCQNVDDITGAQNADDPVNEVRFDKPYLIDDTKDTYVGYSFVVTADEGQSDEFPVLVKGEKTQDKALFLRFGGEGEWWYDYSSPQYDQYNFGDLAMKVLFKGEVLTNAVGITHTFEDITAAKNSEVKIPVTFTNLGNNPVTSLGLTVDVNGEKQEITVTPEKEITKDYEFEVAAHTSETIGLLPVTITVDKVNGQPNTCAYNQAKGNLFVLSRIVDHKVVIEEFTGLWCGWCPKGIVAMEKAKQIYGNGVVVVSVHYNDILECKDYNPFTVATVGSYPQAHVDRAIMSVDPYYGSSLYELFGISKDIENRMNVIPVAEVNAYADIDGDKLTAKSDVRFLYSGSANYSLAFVLTQNGMESDKWEQANNLIQWKGSEIEGQEPMFDKWINGEPKMKGIVFDDVAMAAEGIMGGISGSVPNQVTAEEPNIYEMEFDLHKYKKIMDYNELNLCVFLIDNATGKIVNAGYAALNPELGIESIGADNENVKETARYTIDGRRIYVPEKGVNIVKYSDGKVKKIIVR